MSPALQMLLLGIGLPVLLIALHTGLPHASRLGLWLRTLALALLFVVAAVSFVWLFPPWWAPYAYLALLGLGTAIRLRRGPRQAGWGRHLEVIGAGVVAALLATLAWPGLTQRSPDQIAIDLVSPLGPGRYLVVNGGPSQALNAHFLTLEDGHPYRGQSYAADVIGIDRWGFYSPGVAPEDPSAYVIHGTPILAPCAGTVVQRHDGMPDMSVPQMDRSRLEGNHVLIQCDGTDLYVLLAHMVPGSVSVNRNDRVEVGQHLGQVGNSGNSATPHLHIHVQRGMPADAPLAGEPVFFSVLDKVWLRNTRISLD